MAGLRTNLVIRPPMPRPRRGGWLDESNSTALQRAIVDRAFDDLGILEVPLASNRGGRIDAMTRRAGLAPPQWWCAIWAGAVLIDCGVPVPADYPATDAWIPHLVPEPAIGAAVLYGLRKPGPVSPTMNAHHIGIVVRLEPLVLTIEGNRGYAGTTNDGVAVDIGPMLRKDVLGYYHARTA